jgi:hypothetical protein
VALNKWLWPVATAAVILAADVVACGNSTPPSSSSYPTFSDAGDGYGSLEDVASTMPVAEAGPTQAFVRLAAWSPDEIPIDFCVAPHGTATYEGPLLAPLAAMDEAGAPGLAFPQVSAYIALAPGTYDLMVVAAGAATCAGAIVEFTTPSLAAGTYVTAALVGDAQPAGSDPELSLAMFPDDTAAPLPTAGAGLRFLDVSPSQPAVDFGNGSLNDMSFQDLLSDVPFAALASQADTDAGAIDTNGYLATGPLTGVILSAHSSGASQGDLAVAYGVAFGFGREVTIALVGGKTGDSAQPAELVQCSDGATTGWLSACAVVSQ